MQDPIDGRDLLLRLLALLGRGDELRVVLVDRARPSQARRLLVDVVLPSVRGGQVPRRLGAPREVEAALEVLGRLGVLARGEGGAPLLPRLPRLIEVLGGDGSGEGEERGRNEQAPRARRLERPPAAW
jgi:hypothetical protein